MDTLFYFQHLRQLPTTSRPLKTPENRPANALSSSYWTGKFDLEELSLHNAIEHDGSLTREDAALVPDQSKPDLKLVNDLLSEATGKMQDGSARLTIPDLSRALSKRRFYARKTNSEYSESFFHNVFGSSKFVPPLIVSW